jgi:branched-chain amino acid aminotransferase
MATHQLAFTASALGRRSLLGACRAQKSLGLTARLYSTAKLQGLDASQLSIAKTTTPKELTPPEELIFGHAFTDHMLSCEWTASQGKALYLL